MSATHTDYPATLRLGCGQDAHPEQHNVDISQLPGVDEVVDLEKTPWPWPADTFSRVIAKHVFEHLTDIETALRESQRVLEPGGKLIVVLPMGTNAIADPDHEHVWTWRTPNFYCGKRHWDVDTGLSVAEKEVDLHSQDNGLLRLCRRAVWHYQLWRYGPGEWCFNLPTMSGEFTVVFEA